jgi:hypothetical protein
MAFYTGLGGCLQVGEESTAGTAVTPTQRFPVMSISFDEPQNVKPSEVIQSGNSTSPVGSRFFLGTTFATGQSRHALGYHGIGMLLEAMLTASSATTGPSSGNYTHTYSLHKTQNSYTAEFVLGSSGNAETFSGCKVSAFEVVFEVDKEPQVSIDWVGMKSEGSRSSATGSISTSTSEAYPVQWSQMTACTWNSATVGARKITISGNRNLTPRHKLGTVRTPEDVVPEGLMELTAVVEHDYTTDDYWTGARAETSSDFAFTFTSDSKTFTVTLHNCRIMAGAVSIDDQGVIPQTVTFYPRPDSTDTGMSIVVVNTQSSAVAA